MIFQAFKKTCIYESHMKELGDQLFDFLSERYELKLTCPLGLLWDIICTFTSCLQSDKCIIDGETCQQNDTAPCQSTVELEFYCKVGAYIDDVHLYCDLSSPCNCAFLFMSVDNTLMTMNVNSFLSEGLSKLFRKLCRH